MIHRPCQYPRCPNTFTGPKNQRYCRACGRHRWEKAVRFYNSIVAEGGTRYQEMIARLWDEECARNAAETLRAGQGRQVT